jgi:hypothetical protein
MRTRQEIQLGGFLKLFGLILRILQRLAGDHRSVIGEQYRMAVPGLLSNRVGERSVARGRYPT